MNRTKKEGQVLVITGASSGIGRATAMEWAKQGGSVVLAARSIAVLREVAAICEDAGGKAIIVQTDVTREEDVNKLAQEAVNTFGKLDVWLNNAAVMVFGGFNDVPTEDFRRILETNLFGVIYGSHAALVQFEKQRKGILINMGSIAGIIGQPYSTPYSISKAGIRALGISLGQEFENHRNIHICTVHPSIVDTPVYQNAANYSKQAINPPTSATQTGKVARAILELTQHPQREVFVGKRNLLLRMNRSLTPKLFDKAYRKVMEEIEFEEESVPTTSGNLFEPIPEHASINGGWLEKEKKGKRTTIKKVASKVAIVVGILVGAGWLLSKI